MVESGVLFIPQILLSVRARGRGLGLGPVCSISPLLSTCDQRRKLQHSDMADVYALPKSVTLSSRVKMVPYSFVCRRRKWEGGGGWVGLDELTDRLSCEMDAFSLAARRGEGVFKSERRRLTPERDFV